MKLKKTIRKTEKPVVNADRVNSSKPPRLPKMV